MQKVGEHLCNFVKIHFSTLLVFYSILREDKIWVCRRLFCIASLHPEASPGPAPHLEHLVPKQTAAVPELLRHGAEQDDASGVPQRRATELRGLGVLEDIEVLSKQPRVSEAQAAGLTDVTILVGEPTERPRDAYRSRSTSLFSSFASSSSSSSSFCTSPLSLSFSFSFSLSFKCSRGRSSKLARQINDKTCRYHFPVV